MKIRCIVLLVCTGCCSLTSGYAQEKVWSAELHAGYAASLYGDGRDTYEFTKTFEIPLPLIGIGAAWRFHPNWSLCARINIWGRHERYIGTGKQYFPTCGNELFGLEESQLRRRLELMESVQYTKVAMPAYIGLNFHLGVFRAGIEFGGGLQYTLSHIRYTRLPDVEEVNMLLYPFYDAAVNAGIEVPISETLFYSATVRFSGGYWGNVAVGVGWRL